MTNNTQEDNYAVSFLQKMVEKRPGGEHRPQQEKAVEAIENAIKNNEHLLVQAGTGVGKTFSYAIPAILSGKKIVISTATNQLARQIMGKDIPVLKREVKDQTGKYFKAVLLKGRSNYACHLKFNDLKAMDDNAPQEGLFAAEEVKVVASSVEGQKIADEYSKFYDWVDRTETGDRDEAPAISDKTWAALSSTTNECVGKQVCPFAAECFAEKVRDQARYAQVVITNHAVSGLDIENPEARLLGDREIFIFDEIHELDNYLSSAWGTTITMKMLSDTMQMIKKQKPTHESQMVSYTNSLENLLEAFTAVEQEYFDLQDGLFVDNVMPKKLETALKNLVGAFNRIGMLFDAESTNTGEVKLAKTLVSTTDALNLILEKTTDNVRWVKTPRNDKDKSPISLNCAPLRVGPRLMTALHKKDALMIGTSATITVRGGFNSPIRNFALNEPIGINTEHRSFKALDVGTPFDYARQGMFYLPAEKDFPAADWKFREEHDRAVEAESLKLIKAAGGRALVLTTREPRIGEIGKYLKGKLPKNVKILKQGDAPASQLIEEFASDETSVLIATMGMWHGLDIPGKSCILVIMDKIPFKPQGDPLATARQQDVERNGGNGFMEVYVADANVKLAQGFGRLIRGMTDRGVVAVFDTRLRSKRYGKEMLLSVPDMGIYSDIDVVTGALQRLADS